MFECFQGFQGVIAKRILKLPNWFANKVAKSILSLWFLSYCGGRGVLQARIAHTRFYRISCHHHNILLLPSLGTPARSSQRSPTHNYNSTYPRNSFCRLRMRNCFARAHNELYRAGRGGAINRSIHTTNWPKQRWLVIRVRAKSSL